MMILRKANERGHANHGWLDSYHSFSFAEYYDPKWQGFRSLRVINDDLLLPGTGFGTHPHNNMEIISYVLSGSLEHKDSMGNGRIIRAGEFQYMSAGTGIEHSEFNPSDVEPARFLQIWIKPDAKGVAPRYEQRSLAGAEQDRLHLIASKMGRLDSIAIHQDADLWFANPKAGQSLKHDLKDDRHVWLHVAEGALIINGRMLLGGDSIGVSGEPGVDITASIESKLLLFDLR